ncbi:MAG: glucosamine-6-phosphate deaminase [Muribaculaceae bacterium]|nr:glucosamine-6-phosphate deaminase [Muribaculaceae bacterium]
MKITVATTESAFDAAAASRITDYICAKPNAVIGLSTGRTTGNIHRQVVQNHREVKFDVSKTTFFGLDEVTNVPREYFGACYTMLRTELVDDLGVAEDNFLMLPTKSDDFAAECSKFRAELAARGGIDLLILGLGENGHLGFNQPGTPLGSLAHEASMDERLEERIRRETATPADVHLGGVTLGIADIMRARRIVLVAKGAGKKEIVRQMLTAEISSDIPATVLRLHPDCEFLLDADAAALIDVEALRKL